MPISEHSLLLVIVFTKISVVVLLLAAWLSGRIEPFLQTFLMAVIIVVIGPLTSAIYYMEMAPWVGAVSFAAITLGFGGYALAAYQFRTDRLPLATMGPVILLFAVAVVAAMLSGYDALSIILWQAWAAGCLAFGAANFWMARGEAPVALTILALIFIIEAIPFGLSAAILASKGSFVLTAPPTNWADTASRFVTAFSCIGMASIMLMLSHWRVARRRAMPA